MNKRECPVCGTIMNHDSMSGPMGMEECHYKCPNHCYSYSFEYGGTEYYVWDCMLGYYYSDSRERQDTIERKVKKLVELAKADSEGIEGTARKTKGLL